MSNFESLTDPTLITRMAGTQMAYEKQSLFKAIITFIKDLGGLRK